MAGIVEEVASLMLDTVTIAPFSAYDAYGKPTHGAPVSRSARVVRGHKRVVAQSGDEVLSYARAFVKTDGLAISTLDKVTLPDGTTPKILTVEEWPDDEGVRASTIYFGGL